MRLARLFGVTSSFGVLASCSWASSESAAPEITPVETPAEIPEHTTPIPVETPTPEVVATPTPTPETDVDPVDQVFRMAVEQSPGIQLHPDSMTGCPWFPGLFAGLTRATEEFRIEGDWADVWEPESGGTRWIFYMREGNAGWSNGSPVTAHDFVRTWRHLVSPDIDLPHATILYDVENAREVHRGALPPESLSVRALGDWTLEVELERPRSSFPIVASSPLLVPFDGPALDYVPDELADGITCITNGSVRVVHVKEDTVVLEPFENYWDSEAVSLERIELSFLMPGRALSRFQSEEVDLVRVEDSDLPRARVDGNLSSQLQRGIPTKIWFLVPQINAPPFDHLGVRRALGKVIDRRRLELIVEGRIEAATTFIPLGLFPDFSEVSPDIEMVFDVDEALREIAATPYANPSDWPELILSIPGGNSYRERVARDVAMQIYENLGVMIELEVLDPAVYREALRDGQFALTWFEWTYRYPDPACGYADLFASWSRLGNEIAWQDDGYDELVRLADSMSEVDDRAELFSRCESLLQDRAVYIPIAHPVEHYLLQPWIRGIPTDSRGHLLQPGSMFNRFPSTLTVSERS